MVHNENSILPKPVKCCVCRTELDGLWCTNNVCESCCRLGLCPSVAFCKAVKIGAVKFYWDVLS